LDSNYDKLVRNIRKIKIDQSENIQRAAENDSQLRGLSDNSISIPEIEAIFTPILRNNLAAIRLVSSNEGCDPGKP
jgi:hypothetical protein